MKKSNIKRSLKFNGIDHEVNLTKISQINLSSDQEYIYFDKLKDGSWRLCYTAKTIPDIDFLKSIEII